VTGSGRTPAPRDPFPDAGSDGKEADRVLRAKYHDYCSARVAEVLLALSADEMYVLAHETLAGISRTGEEALTYEEIVRLATERISSGLSLPTFDAWVKEYRKDPERFDQEMLGLWETEAEGDGE
jgi:hypothetical protein